MADVTKTIEHVLAHFRPQSPVLDMTDGISVAFDEWRFNLRGSNTEPLLRLNVEAKSDSELMWARLKEIETLIGAAQ
ncbi:phosphomannomutase/phosphoglucomutase [compost metagenome]